ncbi:MAG: hypothetical protein ABJQ29_07175 [Luteolibacter sp.]
MLWAGADLKPSDDSPTVLGRIFLRYADVRFAAIEKELAGAGTVSPSRPGKGAARFRMNVEASHL